VRTTARVIDGAVLVAAKPTAAVKQTSGMSQQWQKKSTLTLSRPHLRRGDDDALREQLERGLEILESDEHGFRSDFGASVVAEETVSALQGYLSAEIDHLD